MVGPSRPAGTRPPASESLPESRVSNRRVGDIELVDARVIVAGEATPDLEPDARLALERVVDWLETFVNRPHPALGRSGEVCPWTRRTIDVGNLLLSPVSSTDPEEVEALLRALLERFLEGESARGPDSAFRSFVVVLHGLGAREAARFTVDVHARLKPTFLDRGLMLGEFYPTCPKPGLRNPAFRPLQAPDPLLVIRPMVESDVEFLLDQDSFVQAYLRAHRARGVDRLFRALAEGPLGLGPPRLEQLRALAEREREVYGLPSKPLSERPSRIPG